MCACFPRLHARSLRQQHHDLVAPGDELGHGFRLERRICKSSQVIELLCEHLRVLAVLVSKQVLHQRMLLSPRQRQCRRVDLHVHARS